MNIPVEVKGLQDAVRALRVYQVAARERVGDAVLVSAKEIRRGARGRVQVRTGEFRRRIGIRMSKDGLSGRVAAWSRSGRPHPLSHLLEFGTKAHVIVPSKSKKAMAIGGASAMGPNKFASKVHHPGTAAKPWLFPAWEEERPHYVERLTGALNQAGREAAR